MITFNKVSKFFSDGQVALKDITFTINLGEMVFLVGHSGAGKSTLLKLIGLLDLPTHGYLAVDGHDYRKVTPKEVPFFRRRIGFAFQNPHLLSDKTIFENVALPLVLAGVGSAQIKSRVQAILKKVGLVDKINNYPQTLSGGEQQRIGIARAIVSQPVIFIADEPTGNLDPELSKEIMKLFAEYRHQGVTILIATHDLSLVKSINQRILTLDKGELIHDGVFEQNQIAHV